MPKTDKKDIVWDFSPLFSGDDDKAMEKERKEMKKIITEFYEKWKDRDDYLSDPKILKEALDKYEKIMREYGTSGKQGYYFSMRRAQDQEDPNLKAKQKKVKEFSDKMKDKIRFFTISLMKIPEDKQKEFLNSEALEPYKHYLKKKFRRSKYVLSEEEERIMSLKSGPAHSNWTSMRSEFLSKEERKVLNEEGEEEKKPFSEIMSLLSSTKKEVRDRAVEAFNEILKDNIDIAEAEINSVLENKRINDDIRGYERPDTVRFIADDMEADVVDTLIDVVSDNFDITREFYKLKSELFRVDKLEYHERSVPYTTKDKKYSFDESRDLVKRALEDLDDQFVDIFEDFIENGHIDAFPKKGKRDGAFCAYGRINEPVYILLNYTNKLRDVSTLAHELGHGINGRMVKENQNALNKGIPTSTAEVASTFFEDFVLEEVLKDADDELKLSIFMQRLDDEKATIYRQIAAINFEREMHEKFREKGYLSKDDLGKLFRKHMENYMGDYVKQSEETENWWLYWPHLRYFFYNYTYAGGLLISKALQKKVRENPEFIDKVKIFLSAGGSKSPKDIFAEMGIDISKKSFWEDGAQETRNLLEETKDLAKKLGKI